MEHFNYYAQFFILTLCCGALCVSCAETTPPRTETESIYREGMYALERKNYTKAARSFELLLIKAPTYVEAEKVRLRLIQSLYNSGQPEKALKQIELFLTKHRESPYVDSVLSVRDLIAKREKRFNRLRNVGNVGLHMGYALLHAYTWFALGELGYGLEDVRGAVAGLRSSLGVISRKVGNIITDQKSLRATNAFHVPGEWLR